MGRKGNESLWTKTLGGISKMHLERLKRMGWEKERERERDR